MIESHMVQNKDCTNTVALRVIRVGLSLSLGQMQPFLWLQQEKKTHAHKCTAEVLKAEAWITP